MGGGQSCRAFLATAKQSVCVTRRAAVACTIAILALIALGTSRLNPILATEANNQLESRCAEDPSARWTYERSSWTPLRWFCTVEHDDGSKEVMRPDLL